MPVNSLVITACIAELQAMRYTPAGVPALNLRLEHESLMTEAAVQRTVKVAVKALAFGAVAERLAKQCLGSVWRFEGFLCSARQGQSVVFHVQEFVQD